MGVGATLELEWGEHDGQPCILVSGAGGAEDAVRVYPTEPALSSTAGLPAMAGRAGSDGDRVWFVPRFGFVAGTSYTVICRHETAVLHRAAGDGRGSTTVQAIYPSAEAVPRNHLRLYVHFSAPMSEGFASSHVRVADATSGAELPDALLATGDELWDRERRRLTLLFDPGRLKRGLVPNRDAGYPLVVGRPVRVVVGAGFPDARGRPLAGGFARRYEVAEDVRGHVEPQAWQVHAPRAGSLDPVVVDFDRPLDHGLLQHSLTVRSPQGGAVRGSVGTGPEERSWAFFPARAWAAGAYQLAVDHRLEDLAGNSISRVFDRDLSERRDDPRPVTEVQLPFIVAPPRSSQR